MSGLMETDYPSKEDMDAQVEMELNAIRRGRTYDCNSCGVQESERNILQVYGGNEDAVVLIGASGLCVRCFQDQGGEV